MSYHRWVRPDPGARHTRTTSLSRRTPEFLAGGSEHNEDTLDLMGALVNDFRPGGVCGYLVKMWHFAKGDRRQGDESTTASIKEIRDEW
jgi:hypothetical protein